ncbi:MAG: hypothetical protein GXP29_00330 [Planctomycetes bacterium]|nr:hypothetical protein [Planctomycetota bacterium]
MNCRQTEGADAAFHEALASLAARLQIPLLQYDASIFGDDVDGSFADLAHLSRAGATVLTAQLTSDLSKLIERGEITVPSTNAPRSASN